MISKLKRLLRGEGGITGLETAIILIAFVVVAAVFAFTVLSAGVFSSEKGKEAVYAGLGEVRGSMELKGSVIATEKVGGAGGTVDELIFTVANVAGGEPIDLTDECASHLNKLVINYRDKSQQKADLVWSKLWKGETDDDEWLEPGELAEITIDLIDGNEITLSVDTLFAVELKPEHGGILVIERRTPSYIDPVMDLH